MNHIRRLFEEGMPISKIACATHHTFNTIKKYLNPEYSPVNGHYDLKYSGKLTPYEQEIINRRSSGQTYEEIFKFIKSKGYQGSVAAIRMFMQKERAHAKSSGIQGKKEYIHRKALSQLVYRKMEDVKLITKEQYETILKQYPELALLYSLLREFHKIIFSKNENKLEQWMQQASEIKTIPELESYIEGLKQDISAVKNAILYDYNNGLAEGSVTKIKLIKRIMYGRNSFSLLKAKVLLHELLYTNVN
jgi:predicted transcriptional regulator